MTLDQIDEDDMPQCVLESGQVARAKVLSLGVCILFAVPDVDCRQDIQ